MSVAAIVLAAGRGTRFGPAPKVLASFRGAALLRHVVDAAIAGGTAPVIVVTGMNAGAVGAALADTGARTVPNPDYAAGLSTSLRVGFTELPPETEAAIVLLGDMPLVTPALVGQLVTAWREHGKPAALVPTFEGRRGNPAVLSRTLSAEIMALTGDTGAGPLLRGRAGVVEFAVRDPAVVTDIDTEAALAALATQASTTSWRIAE